MDYFKLSKHQSRYDNPLYLSKILYECLTHPMSIDKLFYKASKKINCLWSVNIEQAMLLALCFSYGIKIIVFQDGLLQRRNIK
ncbi:MAG: hypothetical protein HDT21_05655 [Ruminococcus sp.]|nr:hypothetical protein [Ruminococcus sp.]